ncbi:putative lipid II flippase FtsW [Candidatus Saganbacteria bacterium]|uniref:Probable peptidoglycan glycosyltransferase FtsW n=1 Tax=Candidatus Saganbacteria bacterium TaxID=2575572 RepID=A0A9D6YXJ0_UNCSA|nr:putative lipid II flippase FtsW [Candidatus Saganbacteria bacterium]
MQKSKIDYIFLFSVLVLVAVGLIMIFSASPTLAIRQGDAFYYVKRHVFYLVIGLLALYYGLHLDLENLKSKAFPVFIVSVLLLVLVFVPGVGLKVLGASRWIELGLLSFQPSELIKFTTVLFMAKRLSDNKVQIESFVHGMLPALAWLGLISVLILKQPDLGTAITVGATVIAMLFIAGAEIRQLLTLLGMALAGIVAISVTSPYRLRRLIAYIDPWKDPQGIGFHIIQSLLAVGSGGFFGLGLGASRQKFFYLPQQFTDFIFAILCEELGFIGGVGVAVLFVVFAARGFRVALSASDRFRSLLVSGLVSWLTLQAVVNVMVVVGLIPTTGIPLPFISYGGTAVIVNLFSAGIVLNVSRRPQ